MELDLPVFLSVLKVAGDRILTTSDRASWSVDAP